MKRFFTLLLIAMTGQSALWATSFATATTTFQHDLTEKELSDTIKTDPKNQPIELNPSLTPIIVESCYYYTFSVLAMDSVSYKFLFF